MRVMSNCLRPVRMLTATVTAGVAVLAGAFLVVLQRMDHDLLFSLPALSGGRSGQGAALVDRVGASFQVFILYHRTCSEMFSLALSPYQFTILSLLS